MRLSLANPRALAVLGALSAILAGCGGSSPSGNGVASKAPDQIVAASRAAADSAASAHISGSLRSEGSTITLDMNLVAGKGGRGKIAESGLSFELIRLGKFVYINGSPAFYRHYAGQAAAQLLQGKWLKAPASSSDFAALASLTDLHKLLDSALSEERGPLAKGASTTINEQKVIAVNDHTHGGTLFVASTGIPYPIEATKGAPDMDKVVFDRWNVPVELHAPANAIDITKLKAGR